MDGIDKKNQDEVKNVAIMLLAPKVLTDPSKTLDVERFDIIKGDEKSYYI